MSDEIAVRAPDGDTTDPDDQQGLHRRLNRTDRQTVAKIGGTVGLLSGVAQFLGSYVKSGLMLLIISAVIVSVGLALTLALMRGWQAGKRTVSLSLNVCVIVVFTLLLLGAAGGAIGRGLGVLTNPAPTGRLSFTTPPQDLRYRLSASPKDSRTVVVSPGPSGRPVPELTYWFIMEVHYEDDYVEYYPHMRMTGSSTSFDVLIPPRADTKLIRYGRIYALNSAQNAQAEQKLENSPTNKNDYFEKPIGQPVSNSVLLPYK